MGVEAIAIDHKKFPSREEFEREMDAALRARDVELVCNAGFMRLLTPWFVEAWRDRQLNIHPSLLPAFKGLHTHERVLEAGVRISGCTVHFVRSDMDAGPIIAQAAAPVLEGDDAESLAARVLEAEHKLYPHALEMVAAGEIAIRNERAVMIQRNKGKEGNGNGDGDGGGGKKDGGNAGYERAAKHDIAMGACIFSPPLKAGA
jgi:phosphoribosylglycinamide formyltransferase-1